MQITTGLIVIMMQIYFLIKLNQVNSAQKIQTDSWKLHCVEVQKILLLCQLTGVYQAVGLEILGIQIVMEM